MKKYILIPVALLLSTMLSAQGLYINGGKINISSGATLYVQGTTGNLLNVTSGASNGSIALDGTLKVDGNYTNNVSGADVLSTVGVSSQVVLTGTTAQTLGGSTSTPFVFNDLLVNNAAGVTLSKSATVNGVLTLTSGNITTGTNSLTIESAGSVARTSGHIVGNLSKYATAGTTIAQTFEVGTGPDYTPVGLTFANVSTAGYVTGKSTAGDPPIITGSRVDPARSVNRYWTLTENGVVFDTYDAQFNFVAGDVDAGANTSNFIVDKYNAPNWTGTIVGTITPASIQVLGLNSFSDFWTGEVLCLPANAITGLTTQCAGTTGASYAVTTNNTATATYAWSYSGTGATLSSTTGNAITIDFANNATGGTLTVTETLTLTGCSTPNTLAITVNPMPAANAITGLATLCAGSAGVSYAVTTNNAGTATYAWSYSGAGASLSSTTGNAITINFANNATSGTLTVVETITSTGCAATNTLAITVNPLPAANAITGLTTQCAGTTLAGYAVTTNNSGTATYAWSYSGTGATLSSTTGNAITIDFANNATGGTLTVVETITATGCAATNTLAITVNPLPIANAITGLAGLCAGTTGAAYGVTANNTGTATYAWSYSGTGATLSSTTGNAITIDFANNATGGTLTVVETITATGCSTTNTLAITVNPLVGAAGAITGTASATPGTSGVPYSVAAIANATSYIWSFSGTGVTIHGTTNSVTLDFALNATEGQLTVKGSNSCGNGASSFIDLTMNKSLNITVFLEGPYAGAGSMNTSLNDNLLIPSLQPYNTLPWSYGGTEYTLPVPADVVDWVLIELRDAASPELAIPDTKLAGWPKAYFLKSDGAIVDLDGTSMPIIGNPSVVNNLYVVVRHRNHLAVISNYGMDLNANAYTYNFSTAITQAFGGADGYKQIGSGVFGMVTGDADADGSITGLDYSAWATTFGESVVYFSSDLDFDSNITGLDYSRWASNFGLSHPVDAARIPYLYTSQVP